MLALVAAERGGGGDGSPVFFTVPWSPSIAERGGEMPGSFFHWLMKFVALAKSSPADEVEAFLSASDATLAVRSIFVAGYGLTEAMAMLKARMFIVELGLLGKAS